MRRLPFLFLAFLFFSPALSPAKELPKIAVWDLAPGDIKAAYAQDLTSILASEVSKLEKYEVYSQDNIRALAGWTAERMQLGCTDTKCLTALGQMDIAKLISGRVGKIGNTYTISLNLFDTQNAKAEKAVSEFCRNEDDLIQLIQQAVRKLLGTPIAPIPFQEKRKPMEAEDKVEEESKKAEAESEKRGKLFELRSPILYQVAGPILQTGNNEIVIQKGNEKWTMQVDEKTRKNMTYGKGDKVTAKYTLMVLEIIYNGAKGIICSRGYPSLKKYQVTGSLLNIHENIIAIQKGSEKWELGCETNITHLIDVVKVGAQVKIIYQMVAREIEVKAKASTR